MGVWLWAWLTFYHLGIASAEIQESFLYHQITLLWITMQKHINIIMHQNVNPLPLVLCAIGGGVACKTPSLPPPPPPPYLVPTLEWRLPPLHQESTDILQPRPIILQSDLHSVLCTLLIIVVPLPQT